MKPIILIDGSSYFFRAFHALPPLVNSKGQPTGAIYGVVNMVKKLIKDFHPEHVVVVFDSKGKTFRDELYPAYKAHRPPVPDDLSVQFEPMIALLKAMGFPVVIMDGVEADDVIGTMAAAAVRDGENVIISTGDKDFAQLVNGHITLLNTMTNQSMDAQGVIDKFGIAPEQIIDYLTLVGDTVDNVPGVPKCGPKTAVKWLLQYGSLDNLIEHAHEITGKIGEALRASLVHLPLSKKLVTIKTDLDLSNSFSTYHLSPPDIEALNYWLHHLEFKSWIKALQEGNLLNSFGHDLSIQDCVPVKTIAQDQDYRMIQDSAQWDELLSHLKVAQQFAFDTETTSLNPLDADLVGVSFSIFPNQAFYLPLQHKTQQKQLDLKQVLTDLKPLLEDPNKLKIGQNIKYDYRVLLKYNINMQGIAFDTMLESYILNSVAHRHDLETLATTYLNAQVISYAQVTKHEGKTLCFDEVSLDKAMHYAAEDADLTLRLHDTLYPRLSEGQARVFNQIEMPLITVLGQMEHYGVLIDETVLMEQAQNLKIRISALTKEAYALVGREFNLQSPAQLQTILFDELKLPVLTKTPKGQPSTAEAVLQELAYDYRLPELIVEYRRLSKLVSTYIEALPRCIHPHTHRVHTSFNQAVTATGRLSSSDPNLQNIPVRSEEGRAIRKAFIAPVGHVIMSADYSQIELRIMAHLSKDKRLLDAFAQGLDIHTATAAEIFGISREEVNAEHRRRAKAVNFGLIYGMSAFGLAKQLGVERHEADKYVKTYFDRYPGVHAYMEQTREFASMNGYVETILGRRLYLPEINAKNMMRRKAAERMAINAPMQGSAADLIKLAMLAMRDCEEAGMKMILQVHDELIFEVQESCIEQATKYVQQRMEHALQLDVPLLVSVGFGKNWDDAH